MRPPLFILSPPRSFTSVCVAMIGCHPQMFGLAEVNLFAKETMGELRKLYRLRARLQHGLLRSIAELAFSEQSEATIEAAQGWLAEQGDMFTLDLFRLLQKLAPDRGLIDKSPLHIFTQGALERMARNFPDAYFLHLTRHPGDMLSSLQKLRQEIRNGTHENAGGATQGRDYQFHSKMPETMWFKPHLAIVEFLTTIPQHRKMRLRGEDLMTDPRDYARRIAAWMGLATDDDAIEAMLHPENWPFARFGPNNAPYGLDPNFMEQPGLRPYHWQPRPLQWTMYDGRTAALSDDVCDLAMLLGYGD